MIYIYIIVSIVFIYLLLTLSGRYLALFEEEEHVNVNFTASLPQGLHDCIYDGETLMDILTIGVYDSAGNELMRRATQTDHTVIDFKLSLATEHTYNIVLWTQHGTSKTNNIGDMKSINIYITNNDADFTSAEETNGLDRIPEVQSTNQSSIHTVNLVRTIKQIGIDTTDKREKATLKIFGLPASLKLLTKEMNGAEIVTFNHSTMHSTALAVE